MLVERIEVDHDVPGASGYRVTTTDGVLAFTGDIRFHGHHPDRSWAFADAVAGCDMLVTEGTTLSFDETHPPRTEADVARDYEAALAGSRDLMLQAVYPRDIDRVRVVLAVAAAAGRTVLWPDPVAAFLRAAGVTGALGLAEAGPAAVRDAPDRFVVQLDPGDLPGLLDLPVGPSTVMLHANGEPLGPFDPRWRLYAEWLAHCGVPLRQIGCSGHATQDHLHEMVYRVRPSVVVPIHTRSPYRLHPVGGTARLVVGYAEPYDLSRPAHPGLAAPRPGRPRRPGSRPRPAPVHDRDRFSVLQTGNRSRSCRVPPPDTAGAAVLPGRPFSGPPVPRPTSPELARQAPRSRSPVRRPAR